MPLVGGRYDVGPLLGSGGAASVFRAYDTESSRDVALKIIPFAPLVGDGEDPEVNARYERFRREALALSRLRSRHVARVYDFGRDPDVGLYLAMELIDGAPLERRALGRALFPHEVLRVARGLLDALADAHSVGLVHRDVKPTNVIVPRSGRAFEEPRVLDFGIASSVRRTQVDAGVGWSDSGIALGTPAYMAPEVLLGEAATFASDVWSAGLVLFELLDAGPLFDGDLRQQLKARTVDDPDVELRVAAPLGPLLARMLARKPERRFPDARAALEAMGDLETAPVLGAQPPSRPPRSESAPPDTPRQGGTARPPPPASPSRAPDRGAAAPTPPPPPARSAPPPPPSSRPSEPPELAETSPDPRLAARGPKSVAGLAFGGRRIVRLDADSAVALRQTLHSLDLAMTDALARRERGAETGRLARAVSLALRLELDAASLLVEPLAERSALSRALGSTLVAPRARRVTRDRVEHDRRDMWIDQIEPELAAMLASLASAMGTRDDAPRNQARCARAAARLADPADPAAITAKIAECAAASLGETRPAPAALGEMLALRDTDKARSTPFHTLVRALLIGVAAFRGDEHLARAQLERAAKLAAESGNTLLEARAIVAWGGMLVEIPTRIDQGLGVLERATTLLAHGDAPSLEHIAEHNRGAALVIQQRYAEAATHLARARRAARGELPVDHEGLSCANEAFAHLFLGDEPAAAQALADLGEARVGELSARTAAFAHIARSLHALLFGALAVAESELALAQERTRRAERGGGDAGILAGILDVLYGSVRGASIDLLARASEMELLAADHGFASFYWIDNLRAAIAHVRDERVRFVSEGTLERLAVMLGAAPPRPPAGASA